MYKCVGKRLQRKPLHDVNADLPDEGQYVLTLSMEENRHDIRRTDGGQREKKQRSRAKNCHQRAKGDLEGTLIIIPPYMDFTLQGRNDHLMKVFISQILINYSILSNVSVLVF